jgi:peptide/nickel transport system ATP-binding protein
VSPGLEAAVERAEDERTVLEVEKLTKFYDDRGVLLSSLLRRARSRRVKANEDLNFAARRGEILAVVGESGCGKSTFAKVLTGLEAASEGEIRFEGQGIAHVPVGRRSRRLLRAIQMVFQNPEGTLNPSHSVGWAIARAVRTLRGRTIGQSVGERVRELLELVRLPSEFCDRRPRQLSGGQKQRVAIARAFAGRPSLIVADEPVSALDVSVQAAIISLLLQVQARHRTTMVFISHDLSLVRYLADHIVVMYLGRVMEYGPVEAIFEPPYHPYTEALLSAVPVPDANVQQKRIRLTGEIPSPVNLPRGCPFASRCPRKVGAICDNEAPPLRRAGPDHWIACHIPLEELRRVESIFTPRVTRARAEALVGGS